MLFRQASSPAPPLLAYQSEQHIRKMKVKTASRMNIAIFYEVWPMTLFVRKS
jgi:hypothetical protein